MPGGPSVPPPDVYVGIDWSGDRRAADRPHTKLWWAEADDAGVLVRLEPSSRRAVRDELLARRSEPGLVVGIDAGFGYPAWFVEALGCEHGTEVWARAGEVAAWAAARRPPFWGWAGSRRPLDVELMRHTEALARQEGLVTRSVFQVGGPGSVGTGTIAVLDLLAELHQAGVAIWPFTSAVPDRPVVAEVFPRVFARKVVKTDPSERAAHLAAIHPDLDPAWLGAASASDDAFDATLVALGLAAGSPPPLPTDPLAAVEGWIWMPDSS